MVNFRKAYDNRPRQADGLAPSAIALGDAGLGYWNRNEARPPACPALLSA